MNGEPYYVKFRVNADQQEWLFQILPEIRPGQFISSVEVGYLGWDVEAGNTHVPLMRTPLFAHGVQLHTICSLINNEVDTVCSACLGGHPEQCAGGGCKHG